MPQKLKYYQEKTILITGAAGFIGSSLVRVLSQIECTLICCSREIEKLETIQPVGAGACVVNREIDIRAPSVWDEILEGVDVVFHLGAVADVKDVFEEPHYSENINVRGTINVLEAARRSGVKRIIYGSTIWVYSDTKSTSGVVDEDTALVAPSHLYTATKLAGEYYCKAYHKLYGLDYTILRYGIPFGPRAREGAVIPIFVKKALNGEPITIAGDGKQFRKFIYVEDLAEAHVLALKSLEQGVRSNFFNLGNGKGFSVKTVIDTARAVTGRNIPVQRGPRRGGDPPQLVGDSRKIARTLGWRPRYADLAVIVETAWKWTLKKDVPAAETEA